jgi:hypothetical protein
LAKAKITVTITREIEFDPEYYDTTEQMLAEEIRYADELFHEWIESEDVKFETKGELIG